MPEIYTGFKLYIFNESIATDLNYIVAGHIGYIISCVNEHHNTVCIQHTGLTHAGNKRKLYKMIKTLVFLASAAVLVFAHNVPQSESAVAHLEGKFKGAVVKGDLTFTMQSKDKMLITGKITGMPPGKYGLNIHEKGDITNGCASTLGHFNPQGHDHGHPDDEHRHVGDLGNVEFDKSGVAQVKIEDRLVKLYGTEGIIGRSVVLASQQDDHGKTEHPLSKVDGNAGELVACGVIGIK
ncbi:unnamed protein product [Arctia plantaginis]|uniref:superoxide dismutase n=1 Tax=Arctia plantaginis TaxID=874455 RepID=A0A8S1B0S3_ARCPL|nr:unnamed protein product [Arctia plantaginis]